MKHIYYVTVSSMNKKLNVLENIKYAIPASDKESAMMSAKQYGEVLYVDSIIHELGEKW